MSRCVSIVYRRVSETKHLYRDSDTCHRDRSTVQRDIRFCHRDRLSPRPETNRNFTMAVLYIIDRRLNKIDFVIRWEFTLP